MEMDGKQDVTFHIYILIIGGDFKYFLFSPRKLGKISNLTHSYFSDGLKPPARLLYESLENHGKSWVKTRIHVGSGEVAMIHAKT